MVKKKIFVSSMIALLLVITLLMGLKFLPRFSNAEEGKVQSDFYWSEENGPVFYGAIGATISKDVEFDIKDPRFRTFATDFEDGDVAVVCESSNVKSGVPGKYKVVYSATDQHKNRREITVDITITEDSNGEVDCIRRIHTVANDWNMVQAGFNRNHNGDREILGIFMPAGSTFQFRILSEDWEEAKLTLFNNDRKYEKHLKDGDYNTVVKYSTEFTTIQLENKEGTPHDSVPFIVSQLLKRGQDIQTTYDYEIKYNQKEVKKLDYYYYGEDEQAYINSLKNGTNTFGVVEGPDLIILMPKDDVNHIFDFEFDSIKAHLDYYSQVIAMMDETIGLSYKPEKATDQNIRAKQFIKGDAGTGAGAYYNSAFGFIGIGRGQVYSFYQMNWGDLHEIAHGYQGVLGGGSLGLGEVSNNILGHYVQMSDVYFINDRIGLGELSKVEENRNQKRVNEGKGFLDTSEGFEGVRLYALVNLLDAFEGKETYAKLFSWYREMIDKKVFTAQTLNQQDAITTFFAEEYGADIIPYWQQWGVEVSEPVREKVLAMTTKHFSILSDSAGNKSEEIMTGEELDKKYGLVSDEILEEYDVLSSATLNFEIDDQDKLNGKYVLLEKNGDVVYRGLVTNGKVNFTNINAGSYVARFPVLKEYSAISNRLLTTVNGENEFNLSYTLKPDTSYHPIKIRIRGKLYDTDGLVVEFSNFNKTVKVIPGGANLGNFESAWVGNKNEYVSVKFYSANDLQTPIKEFVVHGEEYFVHLYSTQTFDIEHGTIIKIHSELPQNVQIRSMVSNDILTAYSTTEKDVIYEVTKIGLVPKIEESGSLTDKEFDVEGTMYESIKDTLIEKMEDLKAYFEENSSNLKAKYLDRENKDDFIATYERLSEEDSQPFAGLYNEILAGGKPTITLTKTEFEYNENIDFALITTAFDYEDGYLDLDNTNFIVKTTDDISKSGKHEIEIQVSDSEGNVTSQIFEINIKENSFIEQEGDNPSEQKDSNMIWIIIGCAAGGILLCAAVVSIVVLKRKKKVSKIENK